MQALLICALPADGGELSVSRSGRYIPPGKSPRYPRAGLQSHPERFREGRNRMSLPGTESKGNGWAGI